MPRGLILSVLLLLLCAPGVPAASSPQDGILIDGARIEAILNDFIERSRDVLPRAEVRFKSMSPPRSFVLPPGRLTHRVIPSNPAIIGSSRFTIIFSVEGRAVKNISVAAKLEAIAPVVVASTPLNRGLILGPQDLSLAEVDIVGMRNPCFDPDELLGKKLKRTVRLGAPLDRRMVEFPPVIKRGDLVTIRLSRGGMNLTAKGQARQNGEQGETIRVRNSSSRKDVLCRVLAPGLAELEY